MNYKIGDTVTISSNPLFNVPEFTGEIIAIYPATYGGMVKVRQANGQACLTWVGNIVTHASTHASNAPHAAMVGDSVE